MSNLVSSDNALERFLREYIAKAYAKGEIIVFQGEAPRTAFVVKSGVVKTYNLNHNGDEKPVGFHVEGDIFPVGWSFSKAPSALYYYEALTDVVLYHVPREHYIAFLKKHQDELYHQLERMVTDHMGSSMRLNALQHSRASDKLIYTLHYLVVSQGRMLSEDTAEILLDLTHQDFANLTGLTRETAATELNKLKTLGVISYGKHEPYRVKVKELNKALNDQVVADVTSLR